MPLRRRLPAVRAQTDSACSAAGSAAQLLRRVRRGSTSHKRNTKTGRRCGDVAVQMKAAARINWRPHHYRTLDGLDVLTARTLGAVADVEGDCLPFSELVEGRAGAGRLMEKILSAITSGDEPEPLVSDEPLDRAVHVRVLAVAR